MIELVPCTQKWIWSMIFIRVPKNASTSLFNHLGDFNLIKKHEKLFMDALFKNKLYKKWFSPTHAKPDEIHKIFGGMIHHYMSFAVVRNPYDRAVSMFEFGRQNNLGDIYGESNDLTFERFCEILKEKSEANVRDFIATHQQIEWCEGPFRPNFILRFEDLKRDFKDMLDACNIKHISPDIPHENASKRAIYGNYHNDRTRKIIAQVFEKDLDIFKYSY